MTTRATIERRVSSIRSNARFIACTHSSQFIEEAAMLGEGFFYVNLYDTQIDSNVIWNDDGLVIMIHNTYLSSFAYNLLLCWLLGAGDRRNGLETFDLNVLLKHNFKKFYAEQLLDRINNIFARAIFLETLLYEQTCMVPVFRAKADDMEIHAWGTQGAQLMSSLCSTHELGHYYLRRDAHAWAEAHRALPETARALFERTSTGASEAFVEELKCDVLAVVSGLDLDNEIEGREFRLRVAAFSYAAFAVLSSLTKSARVTATEQGRTLDEVDFTSIEKRHRDYTYLMGIDETFVERARFIIELCNLMAHHHGLTLYVDHGKFPLPETILQDLLSYVDRIMENADRNAREMALLVAEAFHENAAAMEFLFLRSRTFVLGSQRNPDGSLAS